MKSRYATDFDDGFPISNFECDFVVFVALNRGYRYGKAGVAGDTGITAPVFYVFPVNVIKAARKETVTWQKVYLRDIAQVGQYINGWDRIADALLPASQTTRPVAMYWFAMDGCYGLWNKVTYTSVFSTW